MLVANGTPKPIAAAIQEEEGILGSILLEGASTLERVRMILSSSQFSIEEHATLFATMLDLDRDGLPCNDPLLLKRKLGDRFDVALIGRLATCVPHAHHAEFWSREVLKRWTARQTAIVAETALKQTTNGVEPTSVIRGLLRDLNAIIEQSADARGFAPVGIVRLAEEHPMLHRVVVEGLIRIEETVNLIAASKAGKSWLTYGLMISVAMGWRWLGRFWCDAQGGRVLLLDFELHPSLIASRLKTVAAAMGTSVEDLNDRLDVVSLRGRKLDIYGLAHLLESIPRGRYVMIVIDAVYRSYPEGFNENSNADVTSYYNTLDRIAKSLGCAVVCVHHASKGDQSSKSVTDVGSGAGAQSRAADAHLILRPHEVSGCAVLEAALRSFPPMEPVTLRWSFPTWSIDGRLDPAEVKGRKTKGEERQEERDKEGKAMILAALADGPRTMSWLYRGGLGPTKPRCERLLPMLISEGAVVAYEDEAAGKRCTFFRRNPDPPVEPVEDETEGGAPLRHY